MKAGQVVHIRINPRDCLSVLDLMEKVGMNTAGMSFSQMAALSFASLIQAARDSGRLPEPDTFQYLNRMTPHLRAHHGKKLAITAAMEGIGSEIRAPKLDNNLLDRETASAAVRPDQRGAAEEADQQVLPAEPVREVDPEIFRMAAAKLTKLEEKKDMLEEGVEGITWTASDQIEYDSCYKIVYPDG